MVAVGKLILAAALPVVQVVLVCSAGAVARRKGILTPEGSKSVAKLIYNILLPSLIIASLGTSVTGPKLLSWWPLPVNCFLNVVLGLGLGAATFPLVRLPKHLWPHYVTMAGVGNLGNLLVVLVPSIAAQSDDFTDDDEANGLAYVFTNLFAICIAAFCIAGPLLELPKGADGAAEPGAPPDVTSAEDSPADSGQTKQADGDGGKDRSAHRVHSITADTPTPLSHADAAPRAGGPVAEGLLRMHGDPAPVSPFSSAPGPDSSSCIATDSGADSGPPHHERRVAAHGAGTACAARSGGGLCLRDSTPCDQPPGMPGASACCACCDVRPGSCGVGPVGEGVSAGDRDRGGAEASGPGAVSAPGDEEESDGGVDGRVKKLWKALQQSLLNPPTIAIAIGVGIAVVTPLRNVLFTEDADDDAAVLCAGVGNATEVGEVVVGAGDDPVDRAELEVVTNALARMGAAMVPCVLLNLGAALYQGPGGTEVSWLAVGMLTVIRLGVLPVLGTLCVLGARAVGVWSSKDRMFELVLLMQHAMPSALNLYTLAAMHGNRDKVIAAMLFWQYMACIFTIPACVTVFLAILQ